MSQKDRRNSILDAAQKRFSHFGVDKTTMNEIADDLGISKASLYYYFKDKLSLYVAVLDRIIDEEIKTTAEFLRNEDVKKGLYLYLEKRMEFSKKYYRIVEYIHTIAQTVPKEFKTIFNRAKNFEAKIISDFLEKGKDQGILHVQDPDRMTALLHDCFTGLRVSLLSESWGFFPTENQFEELLAREKELVDVFFKAMMPS